MNVDMETVTVTVTNVEEAGKVELSTLQPKAGVELTATLTDPDNITASNPTGAIEAGPGITLQWASSSDGSTSWTDIEDATLPTYTPEDGDVGNYLRVTAEYKDDGEHGDRQERGSGIGPCCAGAPEPEPGPNVPGSGP